MTTDLSRVEKALRSLQEGHPAVVGAVLADSSGLPVASSFRGPMELLAVSAMSTLIFDAARRVFRNLGLDSVATIHLEGGDADILVQGLAEGITLILLVNRDGDLPALRREMDAVRREVQEALATL